MDNRRKVTGWVLVVSSGVLGLVGLCLMANALLYIANILQLPAGQDVPMETKLFAVFCLVLPMILLGAGGIFWGVRMLRPSRQESPEKKG